MMRKSTEDKVAVIGGGLGGLAAACSLAARGYEVDLFERNQWSGGKAAVLEQGGFRFDMGPTILTLPSVLRRIFAEAGQSLESHLDLVRLDPQWRSFFDDGSRLDLDQDVQAMVARLRQLQSVPGTAEGYEKFMQLSARLNDISQRYFFYRPVGTMGDMFKLRELSNPRVLSDVVTMRPGRSVGGTIRSFIPDARVAQMLDHFTQYVGSAPDQSPAVLCGIAHMQSDEGVWYPRGGIGAVPQALASLAETLGVRIFQNHRVQRLIVARGRVQGLKTEDGAFRAYAAVVSNADTVRSHEELLDGEPARAFLRRRRYEAACSGVVLYLGLRERYNHLLHHNFVFSRDPHEEFEAIYHRGEPASDPTCYVCAPAATDPTVAPVGGEALYVLVHAPYLRSHHQWKEMFPAYRKRILQKLADTAGLEDLEQRIVSESALTPEDIHTRYHVLQGAIYGLASHGRWTGAFKPHNRSLDVQGLYFAGGSAHPGPGMPMVLMSGWIAADTLDRDGVATRRLSMTLPRAIQPAIAAT